MIIERLEKVKNIIKFPIMKKLLVVIVIIMGQHTTMTTCTYKENYMRKICTIKQQQKKKLQEKKKIAKTISKYKAYKLSADTIYKYCELYNIDYKFLLSVGIIESRLGTDPKAYRALNNNNIFSILNCKYKNTHESVIHFCKLINKDYKVNGKSEQELLDNFVNKNNNRYAESPTYEITLRTIYNNIE